MSWKLYEGKYKFAVYSLIGVSGLSMILFPVLQKSEKVSALVLNLGTELMGGALIFIVLHFFFFQKESEIKLEKEDVDYEDDEEDDQYPPFQVVWSTLWEYIRYINTGWWTFGNRVDHGDCRYTIKFRIDTVSF